MAEKIARARERIATAARRSGRNADAITLMAVTKTVSPDRIREAYGAGLRTFGENRAQEFARKIDALRDLSAAEWHMIGHLHTNKAAPKQQTPPTRYPMAAPPLPQTPSAVQHAGSNAALSPQAPQSPGTQAREQKRVDMLLEINIAGEQAKSGVRPDSLQLEELLNSARELASLQFRGLMTVPPYNDDPEQSRPDFGQMRKLFDQIASRNLPSVRMEVLSMGMSHDFEVAIEEGSTCVRIGTAIFGERPISV